VAEVIRVVTCDRSETIAEIIERITGFRHVSGIEHGSRVSIGDLSQSEIERA
jgi:hypothetical protein